jgi:tRNA threonylcarbamoyladenosine biosynthesis protein TsaB
MKRPMLLDFDTCLGACSACVYDPATGGIVAARRELMARGQAEAIAPMVRAVMAEAKIDYAALSAIAVTIGPGTFTGVRIGLSFAKGLALARQTPLIAITSLAATAAPALAHGSPVTVAHVAGASGLCYVQSFAADGTALREAELLRPEEISVEASHILIGTGASLITSQARRLPALDLPDAASFAAFAHTLPRFKHADVQPLYLRESDAKPQTPQTRSFSGRFVTEADAAWMARLHGLSFEAGWSEAEIKAALALPGAAAIAADYEGGARGFVQYQIVGDLAEIHTMCVEPRWRGKGLGQGLIKALEAIAAMRGVTEIRLDVAADNSVALKLYKASGFAEVGRRKGYYARATGPVDALLMTLKL